MTGAERELLNKELLRLARFSNLVTLGLNGKPGSLLYVQMEPLLEAATTVMKLLREHSDDYVAYVPEVWGPAMADLLGSHTSRPVPDTPEGLT